MKNNYKVALLSVMLLGTLNALLLTGCSKAKLATLNETPSKSDKASLDKSKTSQAQPVQLSDEAIKAQTNTNTSPPDEPIYSTKVESPRLSAIIKSENSSSIGFQTSGVITKINVKAGDVVKKDQMLALLEYTAAYLDAQNAKIDLEMKKTIFNQNEKKYASYLSLYKTGSLSRMSFEDEENNFKLAKLNYESAEISLKAKEYAVKLTKLTAPFDGVIAKSYKSLGDYVTPGLSVFDLVQTNDLSVFAQVPVAFFGKIQTGVILSVINPLNGEKVNMTVNKVVSVIDTQSHTFDIYGKMNDLSKNFLPGMYVEIILK